jgi:hypothetical protein
MKRCRMYALLAFMALGMAAISGCAGWETGGNSSSYPSSGGNGGHRH